MDRKIAFLFWACLVAALVTGNILPSQAEDYVVGSVPVSVTMGDLDGDTDLDLAVANYGSGDASILLGIGDGTFQNAVNYGVGGALSSVAIGDLDGDSDLDLAVANLTSGNVSVLLGNGDGTFQAPVNYGAGDRPVSIAIGDLDGDNDLDLAVVIAGSNSVSVLLGYPFSEGWDWGWVRDEGAERVPQRRKQCGKGYMRRGGS